MLPIIYSYENLPLEFSHTLTRAHTYARDHTLVIFVTSVQLARSSVCLPKRSCLSARVYVSTCVSACSVKSGHRSAFNCFLSFSSTETVNQSSLRLVRYILIVLHLSASVGSTLRIHAHLRCGQPTCWSWRSCHTCGAKCDCIRVFSLRWGLKPVSGSASEREPVADMTHRSVYGSHKCNCIPFNPHNWTHFILFRLRLLWDLNSVLFASRTERS